MKKAHRTVLLIRPGYKGPHPDLAVLLSEMERCQRRLSPYLVVGSKVRVGVEMD